MLILKNISSQRLDEDISYLFFRTTKLDRNVTTFDKFTNEVKSGVNMFVFLMKYIVLWQGNGRIIITKNQNRFFCCISKIHQKSVKPNYMTCSRCCCYVFCFCRRDRNYGLLLGCPWNQILAKEKNISWSAFSVIYTVCIITIYVTCEHTIWWSCVP